MSAGWSQDELEAMLGVRANAARLSADLALDDDLTADRIRDMDMAAFAALRRRAALPDIQVSIPEDMSRPQSGGQDVPVTQASTEAPSGDAVGTQYAGHSVESMDWPTYADFRRSIGLDRLGKGLFN